jgi:hypothetical protein
MRGSLVLLAALMACSDSSGPRFLPLLSTQISPSTDSINGALAVTMNAFNPTDTTERLYFLVQSVFAEVKVGANWSGDSARSGFGSGYADEDSVVLAAGASATVGTVNVLLSAFTGSAPALEEAFALSPGAYSVRACIDPLPGPTLPQGGYVTQHVCANGASFTLTQ